VLAVVEENSAHEHHHPIPSRPESPMVSLCEQSSSKSSNFHNASKSYASASELSPCSLEILQQYFSANEQCFPLTTNQYNQGYITLYLQHTLAKGVIAIVVKQKKMLH